jgi:nicotinamide mononucleotide transporter
MDILGFQIDPFELFGTIFGIIAVWLTIKENKFCFPVGIVNVSLYAWLFMQAKLYADSILQLIYIVLLVFGWIMWSKKNSRKELVVTFRISYHMVCFSKLY